MAGEEETASIFHNNVSPAPAAPAAPQQLQAVRGDMVSLVGCTATIQFYCDKKPRTIKHNNFIIFIVLSVQYDE